MRYLAVVASVLALAFGAAAASADFDVDSVPVMGGANDGETAIWHNIYRHGSDTLNFTWGMTRIQDSSGANVEGNGFGGYIGFSSTGASSAANCTQHGTPSRTRAGLMIDWEGLLNTNGALPGVYRLQVLQGTASHVITRNYLISPQTVPITVEIVNAQGNPLSGVSVSVSQPYSEAWGLTDSNGRLTVQKARQWWRLNLTKDGYRQYVPMASSLSQNGATWKFTLAATSEPVPATTGGLSVFVRDSTSLKPVANATVTHQGRTRSTTADGFATFEDVPTGGSLSVAASKPGYYTGGATVTVSNSTVSTVTIGLARDSSWQDGGEQAPGSGTGSGGDGWGSILSTDWWKDLFTALFVPSSECWESWQNFINEVKAWGPFGVVNQFWEDLSNPGWVSGEQALCWDWSVQLLGGGSNYSHFCLDLRPKLAPEDPPYPYHSDSRGSLGGTVIANVRGIFGYVVYALGFFFIYKKVLPRLSW